MLYVPHTGQIRLSLARSVLAIIDIIVVCASLLDRNRCCSICLGSLRKFASYSHSICTCETPRTYALENPRFQAQDSINMSGFFRPRNLAIAAGGLGAAVVFFPTSTPAGYVASRGGAYLLIQ